MQQNGIVRCVTGDRALVLLTGSDGCATCAGKQGCGVLCGSSKRNIEAWASNDCGAAPGDIVDLELKPSNALLLIFLLFILPVLFLVGALLLVPETLSRAVRAIASLGAMLVGLGAGATAAKLISRAKGYELHVTAVTGTAGGGAGEEGS